MSTDTPWSGGKRSNSRTRTPRPTTPLRPASRSSFRGSARNAGEDEGSFPLNAFEPAFGELSDAMADLEANMMHFQLMHESLARFSESFASFLYGLNMNAFCVDFPEAPISESFRHDRPDEDGAHANPSRPDNDGETTFMQDYGYLLHRKPSGVHQACYKEDDSRCPTVSTTLGPRWLCDGERKARNLYSRAPKRLGEATGSGGEVTRVGYGSIIAEGACFTILARKNVCVPWATIVSITA